jgi:hypothetical protein
MKKMMTVFMMTSTMLATGCATQTGLIKKSAPAAPTYTESQKFFVSGIGQEKTLDAAKICGGADKVAQVQSKLEPKDLFFGIITLGIYTPHTAKVYCQQ